MKGGYLLHVKLLVIKGNFFIRELFNDISTWSGGWLQWRKLKVITTAHNMSSAPLWLMHNKMQNFSGEENIRYKFIY